MADVGLLAKAKEYTDGKVKDLNGEFAELSKLVAAWKTEMLLSVYPVGSIYISVNSTNPGTLYGGTWERIKDRFLLSSGDTYAAGATGGAATVTLTVDQMPKHDHIAWSNDGSRADVTMKSDLAATKPLRVRGYATDANKVDTSTTGGSKAHNNMPPYLAVYVWKRTK